MGRTFYRDSKLTSNASMLGVARTLSMSRLRVAKLEQKLRAIKEEIKEIHTREEELTKRRDAAQRGYKEAEWDLLTKGGLYFEEEDLRAEGYNDQT